MEVYSTQIELILRIFSKSFYPESLSKAIQITPTKAWNKGDEISLQKGLYRKDGKILLRKESAWQYSTGFIETLDFEDVSNKFEGIFKHKILELKKYLSDKKLEVVFDIVVEIVDDQKPSIHFNKSFLNVINQLGAEVDIDMYLLTSAK